MEGLKCKDVIVEFLADYLDRTLSPELTREVAYLNTYRQTRDLVGRQAAQYAMPDEMKDILRRFMLEQMSKKAP
jgi:hypothetical protein